MLSQPELITQPNDLKVSDLIQILSQYDPDTIICIPGYEGGFSPIHGVKKTELLKDVNDEWYYGPHDYIHSVHDPESYQKETFLIILK